MIDSYRLFEIISNAGRIQIEEFEFCFSMKVQSFFQGCHVRKLQRSFDHFDTITFST